MKKQQKSNSFYIMMQKLLDFIIFLDYKKLYNYLKEHLGLFFQVKSQ